MLRTWACLSRSGRKASTTSITLPNIAVRMAWRSFSLVAHSHISSSDFGGLRTSNLPMARAGASAHAATSAMPRTASRPSVSLRWSNSLVGSLYSRIGGPPAGPILADCTSGS